METQPPDPSIPDPSKAHEEGTKNKAEESKIPPKIRADQPKPTLEMPGPFGQDVRRSIFNEQLDIDRKAAVKDRAEKYINDKDRSDFVISKSNVREGTKGLLEPEFNKAKEKER